MADERLLPYWWTREGDHLVLRHDLHPDPMVSVPIDDFGGATLWGGCRSEDGGPVLTLAVMGKGAVTCDRATDQRKVYFESFHPDTEAGMDEVTELAYGLFLAAR